MLPDIKNQNGGNITISVFLVVLFAAFLQASWNALVKDGDLVLLTTVLITAALGESLSASAWMGLLLVCTGIFSMVVFGKTLRLKENRLAFLNAGIIAGYTVVDGIGVRLSDAPTAYVLWIMLFQGIILTGMQLGSGRKTFLAYAERYWKLGVIGGLGMMGSYGLALWAMTAAPIVVVAALRETSILFALLISGLLLGEKIPRSKLMGALFIFSGVVMIRI